MLYPKDPKVKVTTGNRTIKLRWQWKNENGVPVSLITIMIFVFGMMVIFMPEKPGQEMSSTGHFVFNCFLAVSLPCLAVYCMSCLLNWTTVHADHERFVVKTSPFPWFKPVVIPAASIQQFFVAKSPFGSRKIQTLFLLHSDSHSQAIGHYFPSSFAAYQVCHELQDFYGLEDLPVYGQTNLPHQPGPRTR